jgi:hypothetical protein
LNLLKFYQFFLSNLPTAHLFNFNNLKFALFVDLYITELIWDVPIMMILILKALLLFYCTLIYWYHQLLMLIQLKTLLFLGNWGFSRYQICFQLALEAYRWWSSLILVVVLELSLRLFVSLVRRCRHLKLSVCRLLIVQEFLDRWYQVKKFNIFLNWVWAFGCQLTLLIPIYIRSKCFAVLELSRQHFLSQSHLFKLY